MLKPPIYLDYASTTPVDPRVMTKMLTYLQRDSGFGNPASTHYYGQLAKACVDDARAQVAEVINAEPTEIIWTSGATEANNLAIKGAAQLYQSKGMHIVSVATEHLAVLDCCQFLEKTGYAVTYLTPKANGLIDLAQFKAVLRPDTILVSIMHINNETGVQQDLAAIADITAERGIILHVDAAQSIGKVAIDLKKTPIDLLSLSAHKVYGPKGIGALYVRRRPRIKLAAQIHGGGQEQGMRSGTLAPHQIVGMGEAFNLAQLMQLEDYGRIADYNKSFRQAFSKNKRIFFNSDAEFAVPHILNMGFNQLSALDLLAALPELALSRGSACGARGIEPSYVLRALGLTKEAATNSVRFSFGRFTTEQDISLALQYLQQVLAQ
jgi:cysteine desulfurase